MRKLIVFVLLVSVFFTSCTIQKRLHLPGYHIEWNTDVGTHETFRTSSEQSQEEVFTTDETPRASDLPAPANEPHCNVARLVEPAAECIKTQAKIDISKSPLGRIPKARSHQRAALLPFYEKPQPTITLFNGGAATESDSSAMAPASILSFVFGLAFFVTLFLSPYWVLIGFVFPVLSIIFGAVAINRTHKDTQLKGRGLAIAGLVMGIVGLIMIATLFLLLSFAFPL